MVVNEDEISLAEVADKIFDMKMCEGNWGIELSLRFKTIK